MRIKLKPLQILLATHFPALLDRMSGFLMRQAFVRSTAPRERSTLFKSAGRPHPQSGSLQPRRTSVYTAARRHPAATIAGLAAVAGIASLLLSQRRRRA